MILQNKSRKKYSEKGLLLRHCGFIRVPDQAAYGEILVIFTIIFIWPYFCNTASKGYHKNNS